MFIITILTDSNIFTSHVSGRCSIFRSCPSVCVSVCTLQTGPTDLKFGIRIKDHHILNEFEGKGHRSKIKATKVKNVEMPVFSLVSEKVVRGQGHKGHGSMSKVKVV